MDELIIDCRKGARKGQLANYLLKLADEDQRASLLKRMQDVAIRGLSVEIDGDELMFLVHGETEAGARVKRKHAHHGGEHVHEHHHDGDHPHAEHSEHFHWHSNAHEHRTVDEVRAIVEASLLPDDVADDVMGVYGILAQAEAKAHDADVESVHFHEVGNDFAIASIVACCILIDELAPSKIEATPIATGYGFVDCAHGRLPIPAPATANILEGMPHYAGDVEGELCTPTGAAIVRHFAQGFIE